MMELFTKIVDDFVSCGNQSFDLLCTSNECFLYEIKPLTIFVKISIIEVVKVLNKPLNIYLKFLKRTLWK